MLRHARLVLCAALGFAWLSANADDSLPAGASEVLARYVAAPDESFAWRKVGGGTIGSTTYIEMRLISQTWRGVQWKHQLFLLRPKSMDSRTMRGESRQALLFIHGGRWKEEYESQSRTDLPRDARHFARLAETLRAPLGVLRQVPHQPLFDRREDALIAFTFERYLETGESDWPLLLPMVKSAVRGMDAIQQAAMQHWGVDIDAFTVSGASKRGWTAWLTAANDPRVKAVAPMVIDVLNMAAQMDHQRATWGSLSEEISDYSGAEFQARLRSAQGQALLAIVDPYSYRKQLTDPKLILLSTNDRYWPLDALKLYWSGLPQPKHVLYVPNQGHGLRDVDRVIGALGAVHRYSESGEPLPQLSWELVSSAAKLRMAVDTDRRARRVQIWRAHSATRDFREAHWRSSPCAPSAGAFVCEAWRAAKGYTAVFAEASFKDAREPEFSLSTMVCIAASPATDPQPRC
ncbi:MAG: PhoPQ-activated protein PqaA family protein [Steroidobacteraceae bacterium]|jgi:PhoPQ-activated pathogenicity-related protein|nr:PhoPQ-activated protein PqaA family protein [Steroidobacteraceae bacterium]